MLQDVRHSDGCFALIISCKLRPELADGIGVLEEAAGGGKGIRLALRFTKIRFKR